MEKKVSESVPETADVGLDSTLKRSRTRRRNWIFWTLKNFGCGFWIQLADKKKQKKKCWKLQLGYLIRPRGKHRVTIIVCTAGGLGCDFVYCHTLSEQSIRLFAAHQAQDCSMCTFFHYFSPYFLFMSFLSLESLFNYSSFSPSLSLWPCAPPPPPLPPSQFFFFFFIKVLLW